MLVLSRKVGEKIWIGDKIAVTVVRITGGGVRIGIEAPDELPVVREELKKRIEESEALSEMEADANDESPTVNFRNGEAK